MGGHGKVRRTVRKNREAWKAMPDDRAIPGGRGGGGGGGSSSKFLSGVCGFVLQTLILFEIKGNFPLLSSQNFKLKCLKFIPSVSDQKDSETIPFWCHKHTYIPAYTLPPVPVTMINRKPVAVPVSTSYKCHVDVL